MPRPKVNLPYIAHSTLAAFIHYCESFLRAVQTKYIHHLRAPQRSKLLALQVSFQHFKQSLLDDWIDQEGGVEGLDISNSPYSKSPDLTFSLDSPTPLLNSIPSLAPASPLSPYQLYAKSLYESLYDTVTTCYVCFGAKAIFDTPILHESLYSSMEVLGKIEGTTLDMIYDKVEARFKAIQASYSDVTVTNEEKEEVEK